MIYKGGMDMQVTIKQLKVKGVQMYGLVINGKLIYTAYSVAGIKSRILEIVASGVMPS